MLRQSEALATKSTHLLTRKDVCKRLQISARTISRMISDRRLPPPLLIGRNVRWPAEEIEEWIHAQMRRGE